MTREDIIRMAMEANILQPVDLLESNQWRQDTIRELEHFAALVAAASAAIEREACAKVCDTTPPYPFRPSIEAAHALRARGKT